MANEELGIKRDCPECAARFYDLGKEPAECPKCGNEFVPEIILKPRRSRKEEEAQSQTDEDDDNKDDNNKDEAPDAEVSLDEADKTEETATTARKASLDEDEDDDSDDEEIPDEIKDIDEADIDTENDDTLLDNEEDEADLGAIISTGGGDETDDR